MDDHESPLRRVEAEFREALRAYQEHRSKESLVLLERNDETLREWRLKLSVLLHAIRARAQDFEGIRGTSEKERRDLSLRDKSLRRRHLGIHVISGLVILVASYPASISTATILNYPVDLIAGIKVAWLLWVWFVLLVLIAELLLVGSVARFLWLKDVIANLESGQALDEAYRREGKRLIILEPCRVISERQWLFPKTALALSLIVLDFLANFNFLVMESEASLGVAFWIALAGCLSFLPVAILLGEIKYREELIQYALLDRYPAAKELDPETI